MNNFYILILFIILITKEGLANQIISINSSHNIPVKLGDTVTITCKLSDVKNKDIPFIFKRSDEMLSENCKAFSKNLHHMICNNKNEFQFVIKNMSWKDRGQWICMYTSIIKTINLEIYVVPEISIQIQAIPKPNVSKYLGSAALPLKPLNYPIVKGRGTQLNPYDLRNDVSINLICKSDCGFPIMHHIFEFNNSSNFSLQLYKSFSYENTACKDRNRSSAISTLVFNCSTWNLYGLLNLSCLAIDMTHNVNGTSMIITQDNTHILCPTEPIDLWKMTNGEKINTGIGCVIGVMLIMYLFLIVCRWKSNKYNDIDDPCQGVLTSGNNDSGTYKTRGYRV